MERVEHVGVLEGEFSGGNRASCCCGWVGPERESMDEAGADLAQHYKETAP